MEVRCGSCAKLFRVSDDKITGTGIKFACSRCGEYVRVTQEDLEHHALSQSTVSVLDLFEPKPKTAKAPHQPKTGEGEASLPAGSADTEPSPTPDHGVSPAETPSVFSEPASYASASATEDKTESSLSDPDLFAEAKPSAEPEAAVSVEPGPLAEPKPMTMPEPVPQSAPAPQPTTASTAEPEPKPGPKPETQQPKVEATAVSMPKPEPVRGPSFTAPPRPVPAVQPKAPKKEIPRPSLSAEEQTPKAAKAKEIPPVPSRSGRMFLYVLILLVVCALAGYGALVFFQSPQKEQVAAPVMVSIEGLHIENPSGAPDANGDLVITGVVQNSMETARPAWYVVIDVYNAEGVVLNKVRLLNGKQLYSRRDYDILAKRGANIQELKAKTRQEQGAVIPPKGSVNFDVRYVQPPVGVASFNATLQPFDPVRLYKEIALENK